MIISSDLRLSQAHADVFAAHYDFLLALADKFTGNRLDAEDLVHEAFLAFTRRRPDLMAIRDFEAYFNTMIQRMSISRHRAANSYEKFMTLSALEEVEEVELVVPPAMDSVPVPAWEQLLIVCSYACDRKRTSKRGSALLLRFFFGFSPKEISLILAVAPRDPNEWLRTARKEARAYLANPPGDPRRWSCWFRHFEKPLDGLRQIIWATPYGRCLSSDTLGRMYRKEATESIPCGVLAHIVSCKSCLSRTTKLLQIPSWEARDPFAALGSCDKQLALLVPSQPSSH